MKHVYLAIVLFIGITSTTLGTNYYMSTTGSDANTGLSWAAAKATLANVLSTYKSSFASGDTIYVAAGTYTTPGGNYGNASGEANLTSPQNGVVIWGAGITQTIFKNTGSDNNFMTINTNNTVIGNLHITGYDGQGDLSGVGASTQVLTIAANTTGVKIINVQVDGSTGSTSLADVAITVKSGAQVLFDGGGSTCNKEGGAGGGMSITNANVTIENYQFIGDINTYGNGAAGDGSGLLVNSGTVYITNTRFEANTNSSELEGTALYITSGTVYVYDSYFYKNTGTTYDYTGVGNAVTVLNGTVNFSRSVFGTNTGSSYNGGAIGVHGGTVKIDSCLFSGNQGAVSDVYVAGGTVTSNYSQFNSASPQIGQGGGTFTIVNSGNPGTSGTVTKTNTTASSYTPSPTLPVLLSMACSAGSGLCTPPTITVSSTTNIACKGNATGSITVAGSGATAPYTYSWSNAATGATVSSLTSGTYTVTVADATGCTSSSAITLTQPSANLTAVITATNVLCNGASTGAVSGTATTGGTTAYTYSWSTSSTASSVSSLAAGTYSLTVTDAHGCTSSSSVTLTQPTSPLSAVTSYTATTCGKNNGSVSVTASGGTTAYTYAWSTSSTAQTVSSLAAATYTITVTDHNACTATSTATITATTPPTAAISSITLVGCYGTSTGGATVTAGNGTSPYTYVWSPGGATTASISNVAAATYTVTVTDASSCTITTTAAITQPAAALSLTPSSVNSTCGNSNGSVSVTPAGGTSAYTYLWSNAANTQTVNSLAAAAYTVTVTDANSCTAKTTVTLSNTAGPSLGIASVTNATCYSSANGSITVSETGGTSAFTYTWSTGSSTTATQTGLGAGTYTVTITDHNNCTATIAASITQPAAALVATTTYTATTCAKNNGSISVSATGGTSAYTYSWSTTSTAQTVSSVAAATYTVTVTDHNSCTATSTAIVSATTPPTASISSSTNILCYGNTTGSATVNVSNGTPNYTYAWSSGGVTTATINTIGAGTYTVTVTDANACTATTVATLTQPAAALSLTGSSIAATCGNPTGSASVSVTGGTTNYTYAWSNAGSVTNTISNVLSGSYTVTVTDANGCTKTTAPTVNNSGAATVNITSSTNETCYGGNTGAASATVSGGTAPLTYSWSNGVSASTSISNVTAGTYTITVTDHNGCLASSFVTITTPTQINPAVSTNSNSTCGNSNGQVALNVTGGVGGYSYKWSNNDINSSISGLAAATYTVTVKDANLCQVTTTVSVANTAGPTISFSSKSNLSCYQDNSGSLTLTIVGGTADYGYSWNNTNTGTTAALVNAFPGLAAGNYTVTVTDANACTATTSAKLTQPNPLYALLHPVNPTCGLTNGIISVSDTGGTAGYTYLWNTNATTDTIKSLFASTYTVTVTDTKGCTITSSVTLNNVKPPLAVIQSEQDVACYGQATGNAMVSVAYGTPNYSYQWMPGNITTPAISNVGAGNYTVTVTDANSCTSTASITIQQPNALSVQLNSSKQSTCGYNNGTASVVVSGGTTNYTYSWNNGTTNDTISAVLAGTYTVTVTDANACTATSAVSISNIPGPIPTVSATTNLSCYENNTGALTVNLAGGTAVFTYSLSNAVGPVANVNSSLSSNTFTGLASDSYTVTVTDANTCSATTTALINQPALPLTIKDTVTNATCGNNNGVIQVTPSGGTVGSGYSYQWSYGSSTTSMLTGLALDTYSVTVTDANGCTNSTSASVATITPPQASINASTDVLCFANATGALSVSVQNGTPGYTYRWSQGDSTTASISNLIAGHYTVTVTDVNSCITTAVGTIHQPFAALSVTDTAIYATCILPNGLIIARSNGGTPTPSSPAVNGYFYQWSGSATTNDTLVGLGAATYTVTVTDGNGCMSTATATIKNVQPPIAVVQSESDVLCNNTATGNATVAAALGTPGYIYSWMPGGSTNATLSNVGAGIYTVTVTDASNCTATATITINQPAAALSIKDTVINTSCNNSNGIISLKVSGGTPNAGSYAYSWSVTDSTRATLSGLSVNTYSVTVTDANGCVASTSATISAIAPPQATIQPIGITNVSCYGNATGALTVTGSLGTPTYTYQWSQGDSVTSSISNLSAGSYTVTLTDANGCSAITSASITQPSAALSVTDTAISTTCSLSNGNIVVQPHGGTPGITGYIYQWNPSNYSGSNLTNINAGTYSVTVTDANACIANSIIVVGATLKPEAVLQAETDVACNGSQTGTATVSVAYGTAPYTYAWLPAGGTNATISNVGAATYTVTVTDALGCTSSSTITINQPSAMVVTDSLRASTCGQTNGAIHLRTIGGTYPYTYNWQTGSTSDSLATIASGTYPVTITDAAGCTVIQNPVVKDLGAAQITLSASSNALCKGQTTTISAAISGGSKPYTYSWSGGLSNQPIQTVSPGVTTPYTLQVTDSAGCVSAAQVDTIKVTPPPIVTLSADITTGCGTPLCVTFNATPAGMNTQQTWSYGDNSNPDNTGKHCYTTVGKYNVQVTVDSNGCSTTAALADTIRVQFKPTPVFSYAPTSEILQDSTVHFVNLTQSATVSRWNFADLGSGANDTLTTGQGFTGSISHIFADTGTYCVKLTAYASALCYDSTTQCLTINETCHWPTSIPNVFTPNNDGKNDVFVVSSAGLSTLTCTIFNRWGMELYQYNAIESGWDGRTVGGNIAPEGTYFYIFNATCLIGNKKKEAQGYIQLQR